MNEPGVIRYNLDVVWSAEDQTGEWVPYEDHKAEIERLKQDLTRAESARVAILAENTHYKQRARELETFIGAMGWTFDGECFTAQPSPLERTVEEINAQVDERIERVERELAQPHEGRVSVFVDPGPNAEVVSVTPGQVTLYTQPQPSALCEYLEKIAEDFENRRDAGLSIEFGSPIRAPIAVYHEIRAAQPPGDGWDANGSPA